MSNVTQEQSAAILIEAAARYAEQQRVAGLSPCWSL